MQDQDWVYESLAARGWAHPARATLRGWSYQPNQYRTDNASGSAEKLTDRVKVLSEDQLLDTSNLIARPEWLLQRAVQIARVVAKVRATTDHDQRRGELMLDSLLL